MAEKIMTLSLGGVERTLNFGKFWFQKYYGQATGDDPLNSTSILLSPEKQFDFVVNIVYAGLRTHYKSKKINEDFNKEQVEDWIGDKEDDEIVKLINDYKTLTTVPAGEAEAP